MLPVTMESPSNSSFLQADSKVSESRLNQKQGNTYNMTQHERTVEMLTRLNN
jgi:hypothetical protein